jgi:hypothetical protein
MTGQVDGFRVFEDQLVVDGFRRFLTNAPSCGRRRNWWGAWTLVEGDWRLLRNKSDAVGFALAMTVA